MQLFKFNLSHDNGTKEISINSTSKEKAILAIMDIELCPRSAITDAEEEEEKTAIAVIDLSNTTLSIYDVPESWDSEQTEEFIDSKGHHLSNCSWGEFDGTINDFR